ncbi:LOW QUALITY PROTEIN: acetylornithine aminotransferase [Psychrobacter sp. JCM 18900]|nr:LOW QUALITY PROTEIN: acetylornithine aminotransferase [Psychrobacter sp. JCM 18900]
MSATYLMPTYNRQPISFTRGAGSWLYTKDDTPYLDALTGIAVCGLGHCHPQVTDAIQQQAGTLIHTSNLFGIDWQERAGEILCTAAQMDSVFFCQRCRSQSCIKAGTFICLQARFKRPKVIVMEQSFHGRTLLSLSATANPKAREGFYTLDEDFIRVPFGDIEAVKQAAQEHDDICAIFVEPIQGEGGLNTAANGFNYLEELQAECDAHNWLFMLDEVQTGNGRTGKYFAYQHSNARPDVLTTAKGLGNGFPVGACMVRGRANGLFGAGSHGSTYGGTPLASRVVHSVYDVLANSNIMENAVTEGLFIRESIVDTFGQHGVSSRGAGMMIGIALPEDMDCSQLVDRARDEQKLIINVTGGHVVRLLPPLNMSRDESTQVAERLINLLKPSF